MFCGDLVFYGCLIWCALLGYTPLFGVDVLWCYEGVFSECAWLTCGGVGCKCGKCGFEALGLGFGWVCVVLVVTVGFPGLEWYLLGT